MRIRPAALAFLLVLSAIIVSGCTTDGVDVDVPDVKVTVDVPDIEINIDVPDIKIDVDVGEAIRGSGHRITEDRAVSDFDRVSLVGTGNVSITQGGEEALVVEADDNLVPYISAKVRNGKLILGFTGDVSKQRIRPSEDIKFILKVKELTGLDIIGAGDIDVASLDTDRLEVVLNGAGDISIGSLTAHELVVHLNGAGSVKLGGGRVLEQGVFLNGAGDYRAPGLQSRAAVVEINGVGNATLWATDSLDVRIPGAGNVEYYGDPQVTKNISVIGRLVRLGNP